MTQDATAILLQGFVRHLTAELDAKFGTAWTIYRTNLGHWVFRGEVDHQECIGHGDDIIEALRNANLWKPLPLVPRTPMRYFENGFVPKKHGSKWRLEYTGHDCHVMFSTKREAVEYARRKSEQTIAAYEDWVRDHGWTIGKKEYEDFRYAPF